MSEQDAAQAALAALGMTADVTTEAAPVETQAEVVAEPAETPTEVATAPAETQAEQTAFVAGAAADVDFDDIPAATRTFTSRTSPYGFDEIAAPGTAGKKYHGKLVPFEGGDDAKFRRSVQSAATGKNKGSDKYFVTRKAEKDGKFIGMYIIRTDARPVAE